MVKKGIFVWLLALVLALGIFPLSGMAAEPAVLSLPVVQAEAGETVVAELTLENNPGIAAAQIRIDYDPTKLRPVDFVLDEEVSKLFMISLADADAGSVMLVALQDVEYDGVIARLEFKALAQGEAEIGFSEATLYDYDSVAVECRTESGMVEISEGTVPVPDTADTETSGSDTAAPAAADPDTAAAAADGPDTAKTETSQNDTADTGSVTAAANADDVLTAKRYGQQSAKSNDKNAEPAAVNAAVTAAAAGTDETGAAAVSESAPGTGRTVLVIVVVALFAAVIAGVVLILRRKGHKARH